MPVTIVRHDAGEWRVRYANRAAVELWRSVAGDALTDVLLRDFHARTRGVDFAEIFGRVQAGLSVEFGFGLHDLAGSDRTLRVVAHPLETGEHAEVVTVGIEVASGGHGLSVTDGVVSSAASAGTSEGPIVVATSPQMPVGPEYRENWSSVWWTNSRSCWSRGASTTGT